MVNNFSFSYKILNISQFFKRILFYFINFLQFLPYKGWNLAFKSGKSKKRPKIRVEENCIVIAIQMLGVVTILILSQQILHISQFWKINLFYFIICYQFLPYKGRKVKIIKGSRISGGPDRVDNAAYPVGNICSLNWSDRKPK